MIFLEFVVDGVVSYILVGFWRVIQRIAARGGRRGDVLVVVVRIVISVVIIIMTVLTKAKVGFVA